jgi:hypothetical protein
VRLGIPSMLIEIDGNTIDLLLYCGAPHLNPFQAIFDPDHTPFHPVHPLNQGLLTLDDQVQLVLYIVFGGSNRPIELANNLILELSHFLTGFALELHHRACHHFFDSPKIFLFHVGPPPFGIQFRSLPAFFPYPPLLPVCLGVATMGGKIGSDTVDPPLHTIDALFKPRLQAIHSLGKHLLPFGQQAKKGFKSWG